MTATPLQLRTVYTDAPITDTIVGDIRFVCSAVTGATDDTAHGLSPQRPFATIDYAIGKAGVDGTIYVLPGHTENLASATALVCDVAGQKIIGLGSGTRRPTLSITAAAGLISVTAASVHLENLVVVGNFLNIVTAMSVGANADGLTLKNIETKDTSAVLGALIQISVAAGCTDVTIDGYKHFGFAGGLTAPATNVVVFAGAADRLHLVNSEFHAHTTGAVVALSAAASKDIFIDNVTLLNTETGAGLGVAAHNSTTGYADNFVGVNLKNAVKPLTGTGLSIGPKVMYSNAVNAYAGLFCYTVDS